LGARKLLAWASLLSGTLSFSLVKMLLTTEHAQTDSTGLPLLRDTQDAVIALNTTLGAYILQPAEEEDKFRFSHDRYLQAAMELTESQWDTKLMHYVIAKTIVLDTTISDDTALGSNALYTRSRHICLAIDLIKERETSRSLYREVLYQAAETACESGARSTGMFYYAHCLMLLQDDPWDEDMPDVSYQETLQLFVRSAECYWHQGLLDEALALIRTTFKKAKDPVDMVSLQSEEIASPHSKASKTFCHCLGRRYQLLLGRSVTLSSKRFVLSFRVQIRRSYYRGHRIPMIAF
jgi:hypothetical protein